MKTVIEIRECDWVNGKAVKWQGHLYHESKRLAEPMISGIPERTKDKAKASLWKTITDMKGLIRDAEILAHKADRINEKEEEMTAGDIADIKKMAAKALKEDEKLAKKVAKEVKKIKTKQEKNGSNRKN